MKKAVLTINGMGCDACVNRVKSLLSDLPDVSVEKVSLDPQEAVIEYSVSDPVAWKKAVENAGYSVTEIHQ